MPRRRRTGQIVDPVDLSSDLQRLPYALLPKREVRVVEQRPDIPDRSGMKIVDANYRIATLYQLIAKVGADEAGPPCDARSMAGTGQRSKTELQASTWIHFTSSNSSTGLEYRFTDR